VRCYLLSVSFEPPIFKDLKQAHVKLNKMSTESFVETLNDQKTFLEYHCLYKEQRDNWKVIPAEKVAAGIYESYLTAQAGDNLDYRIIDFGCGIDGLFEHKLADLLAERDANGNVHCLAVDAGDVGTGDLAWPNTLTKDGAVPQGLAVGTKHTKFTCDFLAGDYSSPDLYNDLLSKQTHFDAGVFCLSIMAGDALERALLIASKTIKPSGLIIIVLDMWKFVDKPHVNKGELERQVSAWCGTFAQKTGFAVNTWSIDQGPLKAGYLEVSNCRLNEQSDIKTTLQGVKIKDFKQVVLTPAKQPSEACSEDAANETGEGPQSEAASMKRSLSYDAVGPSKKAPPKPSGAQDDSSDDDVQPMLKKVKS